MAIQREEKTTFGPSRYAATIAKFDGFFQKQDPQLMQREKLAFTLNESPHKPYILGLSPSKKGSPSGNLISSVQISMGKLSETNLHFPARKTVTNVN